MEILANIPDINNMVPVDNSISDCDSSQVRILREYVDTSRIHFSGLQYQLHHMDVNDVETDKQI